MVLGIIKSIIIAFFQTVIDLLFKKRLDVLPFESEISKIRSFVKLFIYVGLSFIMYILINYLLLLQDLVKMKNEIINKQQIEINTLSLSISKNQTNKYMTEKQ